MKKSKKVFGLFCVAVVSSSYPSNALGQNLNVGNGLIASSPWDEDSTLSSAIYEVPEGWLYSYVLSVTDNDVSHFILETCSTLNSSDISDMQSSAEMVYEVGFFEPGNSNPGLEEAIYGIKLDMLEDVTSISFSFVSQRQPDQHSFYAKGGVNRQGENIFLQTQDNYFLSSPGCAVIPEPAVPLMSGLFGVVALLRRKRS